MENIKKYTLFDFLNNRMYNGIVYKDKIEWRFLRNCIDYNIIELKEDNIYKVIDNLYNLYKLGYYCIMYDVLTYNKDEYNMYQYVNDNILKELIKLIEIDIKHKKPDMNLVTIYDYLNKGEKNENN